MAGLSFRSGPALVELSAQGEVTAVRHEDGDSYLDGAGAVQVWTGGVAREWSPPTLEVDADEVEVTRTSGALRVVVRHTFAAGWAIRLALTNTGPDELVLDDVRLGWRAAPGRPVTALAAGAAGSVAVLPADGAGPLLGAVLRLGVLDRVDADGLHLGRVVLAPQGRFVEQWHVGFQPGPGAFGRGLHPEVPVRLDLELGDAVSIATTEDEALVLGEGLVAEPVRGGTELTGWRAGTHEVELRSARGSTRYPLRVAEPWSEVLRASAAWVLDRPRTSSGVVPLSGPDQALVVQAALAAGVVEDDYEAEDALDLYGARLPEDGDRDARTIGWLCAEHDRVTDPEPLTWALRGVLGHRRPEPGLGLVATRVCLALVVAGRPVTPVVEHLRTLAREAERPPGAGGLGEQAALLELEVVTMARRPADPPAAAGTRPSGVRTGASTWLPGAVLPRTAAVGDRLGGGLTGRPVPPLPLELLAHVAAVLTLLPEPVSAELAGRWGCSAHELGRRARAEVLARLEGPVPGPAHGWLVLASRPG